MDSKEIAFLSAVGEGEFCMACNHGTVLTADALADFVSGAPAELNAQGEMCPGEYLPCGAAGPIADAADVAALLHLSGPAADLLRRHRTAATSAATTPTRVTEGKCRPLAII